MKPLLWMDLEMTGLDENRDKILEIAAMVTSWTLKPLEEYHRIVFQPPDVLETMNDWCKKTHGASGLTELVPSGTALSQVEDELIALLDRHYRGGERVVIAGNSIWNDRKFLDRYLPSFAKRLHYRMVDVSSFKEVFREKFKVKYEKNNAHRAIGDIQESIKEFESYLEIIKKGVGHTP